MTISGDALNWVRMIGEISKWVVETIVAFVKGDDSPDVRKLIDILPAHFKSDLEHARQREVLRQELEDFESGKIK